MPGVFVYNNNILFQIISETLDRQPHRCLRLQGFRPKSHVLWFHVLHSSPEGVRQRWPHPSVAGTHSHRSATADNNDSSSHLTIPRWDESLCATWWRRLFGLVSGGARTTARMRIIPAFVQHLPSQLCWTLSSKDSARIRPSSPSWCTWRSPRRR